MRIVRLKIIRYPMLFILRARIWQRMKINRYLRQSDDPKLQIGFGNNPLNGWLNTGVSLSEIWHGAYLDAGKQFPLPDSSLNYVYSEHVFEHLSYQQGINMLKESYRVLKPGGLIRIATPNLQFLLDLYQEPENPLHRDYIEYSSKHGGIPPKPVYVISRFHTDWGHKVIYDRETLANLLEEVGFTCICICEVGKSKHSALIGVEGHDKVLPDCFNRLETMILEAVK